MATGQPIAPTSATRTSTSTELLHVVLDSNIWLDLFVFDDPRVRTLGGLLRPDALQPIASAPMLDELRAVLDYAHLRARYPDGQALLERVGSLCTLIATPAPMDLPRCRDPHDQKFLEAAAAGEAQLLVSKDKAVLKLARRFKQFAIVAPGPALDAWIAAHCPPA